MISDLCSIGVVIIGAAFLFGIIFGLAKAIDLIESKQYWTKKED